MKNFIYLVQGEAELIKKFFSLKARNDIDAILLTFDEQINGAIFYPSSSWAQGRNLLLKKALEKDEKYRYYIFLDDDIHFLRGSFSLFEKQLIEYNPAIAVPVFCPKTEPGVLGIGISCRHKFFIPLSKFQLCSKGDAQFIAFHADVIRDRLIIPLQTQFDDISWHAVSSTQQLLILNFYKESFLQFNNILIENSIHRQYPLGKFWKIQKEWFADQFILPISDPRKYAVNLLSQRGVLEMAKKFIKKPTILYLVHFLRTLSGTFTYKKQQSHHIAEEKIAALLKTGSDLFKQFSALR